MRFTRIICYQITGGLLHHLFTLTFFKAVYFLLHFLSSYWAMQEIMQLPAGARFLSGIFSEGARTFSHIYILSSGYKYAVISRLFTMFNKRKLKTTLLLPDFHHHLRQNLMCLHQDLRLRFQALHHRLRRAFLLFLPRQILLRHQSHHQGLQGFLRRPC